MPPLDEDSVRALSESLSEIINAGVSSKLIYEGSVCDAYPCWNDGVCVESNSTARGYFCMCSTPFTGSHCQSKMADNCSSIICEAGSICIQELSNCLPLKNLTSLNACQTNPCLNGGHCAVLGNNSQRCLCTSLFHGILCEIPSSADFIGRYTTHTSWSLLQNLFLIALMVLFLAGCLAFCYGGNLSCYLLIPDSRQRYSKWKNVANEEYSWDPEESDEDDFQIGFFGRRNSRSSNSPESGQSKIESIEMKSKPMKVSTTSETFISYDPTVLSPQDTQRALLPSIS
ncbi:hypothetical protein FO519_001400 [Halicephalobus sp. NKZ332]|nr:hypothetical protein FO519_001400 [Halicephalobus sp. NKZ332]